MNIASLALLLRETAERHDRFEQVARPHNWWDWYAPYIDAREKGSTPEQAAATADRYMQEARGGGPMRPRASSHSKRA